MSWTRGEYMADVGGHRWRDDRGPDSVCERCRLPYPEWSGDPCPAVVDAVTGMDDLVTWLRAQLDDDERKVAAMEREEKRVQTAPIFQGHPPNWLAGVDIFVSSKRWRAETDAKRRILDLHSGGTDPCDAHDAAFRTIPCDTQRLLALPYAGREGYREEWRP